MIVNRKSIKVFFLKLIKTGIFLFLFIFFWYAISILLLLYPLGAEISSNLTKEKILSLKIGMSPSEIKKIMGEPLGLQEEGDSDYWTYASTGFLGAGFEMFIVIKDNKLYRIHIEENDLGVYQCKANCCRIFNLKALEKMVSLSKKK